MLSVIDKAAYAVARSYYLCSGAEMNLLVLNLPRDFTKTDLTQLFEPYGAIKLCNIVMDLETNTSKGFGFVDMEQDDDGEKAMAELHGHKIRKNKIRVKPAS